MHRSRATLIAITATLGIALPAAAASIGPVVDASDDVWMVDFQSAEGEAQPDQRVPDTDVRRLSAADPVDTGRGSSMVSLTLELAAAPRPDTIVTWVIGAEGSADVQAGLRYGIVVAGTTGEHSFARVDDPQGGGLEFGCPGSTHRWATATTLEVSFDSACIRAPRSLPTAARVFSFTDTAFWFDLAPNARNRSELRSRWADPDQPPAFTLALPGSGTGLSPTARDASRTCEGARSGRFPTPGATCTRPTSTAPPTAGSPPAPGTAATRRASGCAAARSRRSSSTPCARRAWRCPPRCPTTSATTTAACTRPTSTRWPTSASCAARRRGSSPGRS